MFSSIEYIKKNNIDVKGKLTEKFLRYVAVESQSKEGLDKIPSSEGQRNLAKMLAKEVLELGAKDVEINRHSVVQAYIPGNLHKAKGADAIGWVCHLDTVDVGLSPRVKAKLVKNYQGGDLCQNKGKNRYIRISEHEELLNYIGQDLILSDGSSVLGADNKAAIANVMTALEILKENPELEHGPIYLAFVPDEEVGLKGARKIDFKKFKADYAYTIDCCELGELAYQTFNAGSAKVEIKGVSAHPMKAKGNLVNPIMVATDFINLFDRAETPECTEGKEGYIWFTDIEADVLSCKISINIRDHDREKYNEKKTKLRKAVEDIKKNHPRAEINLDIEDVYGNIVDAINEGNKKSIDNLFRAFDKLSIKVKDLAMRGGTDGSYISTRGIPTPNYFTGAHNFHSSAEFLPLDSFEKSTLVTLQLIELGLNY